MPKPCGHAEHVETCHLCRLYRDRPDYKALWDGTPAVRTERCPHLWKRAREDGKPKQRDCGLG